MSLYSYLKVVAICKDLGIADSNASLYALIHHLTHGGREGVESLSGLDPSKPRGFGLLSVCLPKQAKESLRKLASYPSFRKQAYNEYKQNLSLWYDFYKFSDLVGLEIEQLFA